MLRAGLDDPLVVLLVALLPNLEEIVLKYIPSDVNMLQRRTKHGFPMLQRLRAGAGDGKPRPLAFFNTLLSQAPLHSLVTESRMRTTKSWNLWREMLSH
jgi:hypothetical protein